LGEIPGSLFVITMKIWECLSERGKVEWPRIYKRFKRQDWIPPVKDKRAIQCETKIEDIEEISRFMAQKPNPTERT